MLKQFINKFISFFRREKREYLVIPKDTVIKGELSGNDLYIDGQVFTEKLLAKYIELGNTGYIDGDIDCSKIVVQGTISGNIKCDIIILRSGSQVTGNINCNAITIQEGADMEGNITYTECSIESDASFAGTLTPKIGD